METFIPLTRYQIECALLGYMTLKTISGLKVVKFQETKAFLYKTTLEDDTVHYYTNTGRYLPCNNPNDLDLIINN